MSSEPEYENFGIRGWRDLFFRRTPRPIQDLIPCILNHYLTGTRNEHRRIFASFLHRREIYDYLTNEIEMLNNIRGNIPADQDTIKIPTKINLFRGAFPEYSVVGRTGNPIRISQVKVLNNLGFNSDLEALIRNAILHPPQQTAPARSPAGQPFPAASAFFNLLHRPMKRPALCL